MEWPTIQGSAHFATGISWPAAKSRDTRPMGASVVSNSFGYTLLTFAFFADRMVYHITVVHAMLCRYAWLER
ncbi:hypothetical protein ES708_08540 [subsurface metagenome]